MVFTLFLSCWFDKLKERTIDWSDRDILFAFLTVLAKLLVERDL